MTKKLMVIGAHPDDCELIAGGTAALFTRRGGDVMFVSTTNGDAGHQTLYGERLAAIRRSECMAVAQKYGLRYTVMQSHDGRLTPDVPTREALIRVIRSFSPDLILTHCLDDYHPDHRGTVQLVLDSAYLLQVPAIAPDTPPLSHMPAIWHAAERPEPGMLCVDIGDTMEQKIGMTACHRSQILEWLPWVDWHEEVPEEPEAREAYLYRRSRSSSRTPDALRPPLPAGVREAECFLPSVHGGDADPALLTLVGAVRA